MERKAIWGVCLLAVSLLIAGSMAAIGPAVDSPAAPEADVESATKGTVGPDVIVGVLNGVNHYGSVGDIRGYAVGTTSCNKGDEDLEWTSFTNRHPVIAQNMYRLKDGRFTQLGQSWLKHGFLALAQNECDLGCQNPNDGSLLGVGCSDPYTAGLNGSQGGLGPRFEVNASTGHFEYPFAFDNQTGNSIYKRLQVLSDDVDPSLNSGAKYWVEGQYVTPDDAEAGNQDNNASYREIEFNGNFSTNFIGATRRERPAIFAWRTEDPTVNIEMVDIADDGVFYVANKVEDNLDGTWRYEYAVHNLNSHRSAASFTVPISKGANVTNIGFKDVPYHSGEPYDGTDWVSEIEGGNLTWAIGTMFMDGFETGDISGWAGPGTENANALRWGTMYNFWFDADQAPSKASGSIGLFREGFPASMSVPVQAP